MSLPVRKSLEFVVLKRVKKSILSNTQLNHEVEQPKDIREIDQGHKFRFNSLPNYKILAQPKFKVLAEDKINVTQKLVFFLRWVENILGKGENAGYHHFPIFPKMFSKASFLRTVKNWDCVVQS